MSIDAISWALKQPVDRSTAKFVLVVLADNSNSETLFAYPSVAYLAEATSQDRKTVLAGLQRLVDDGYITDTGHRRGSTGQVIVYRINARAKAEAKEGGKRDCSDGETVPKTAAKGPVFPVKESQKRDTEPSLNQEEPKEGGQASAKPGTTSDDSKPKEITLAVWLRNLPEGEPTIGEDDPVWRVAGKLNLPNDFIGLAWQAFERRYIDEKKRYVDWRRVFRKAVTENWLKLWHYNTPDGSAALTTTGQQAKKLQQEPAHA